MNDKYNRKRKSQIIKTKKLLYEYYIIISILQETIKMT